MLSGMSFACAARAISCSQVSSLWARARMALDDKIARAAARRHRLRCALATPGVRSAVAARGAVAPGRRVAIGSIRGIVLASGWRPVGRIGGGGRGGGGGGVELGDDERVERRA